MSTPQLLSLKEIYFLVEGSLLAAADRPNLSKEQKDKRFAMGWQVIQSLGPLDAPRALLAGQGLALNEMLADASRDAIQAATEETRRAARANYAAVYRAFQQNTNALARMNANALAAERKEAKTEAPAAKSAVPAATTEPPGDPPPGQPPADARTSAIAPGKDPEASGDSRETTVTTDGVRSQPQPAAADRPMTDRPNDKILPAPTPDRLPRPAQVRAPEMAGA